MCHETRDWLSALPVALLGLRTCLKEDLGCSAAELVYGTTLRVPAEFFSHEEPDSDPQIFLEDFRQIMRKLRPIPTAHHTRRKVFHHKDLYSCTHVFVRRDATKQPLQQPYSGPHPLVERITDRVFAVDLDGRTVNVTVERLKPAYLAVEEDILAGKTDTVPSTSAANNNVPTDLTPALKMYSRKDSNAQSRKTVRFA
ncbi:uncharacterized protein LOC144477925 [Augochlora pura]